MQFLTDLFMLFCSVQANMARFLHLNSISMFHERGVLENDVMHVQPVISELLTSTRCVVRALYAMAARSTASRSAEGQRVTDIL